MGRFNMPTLQAHWIIISLDVSILTHTVSTLPWAAILHLQTVYVTFTAAAKVVAF